MEINVIPAKAVDDITNMIPIATVPRKEVAIVCNEAPPDNEDNRAELENTKTTNKINDIKAKIETAIFTKPLNLESLIFS